MINSLLYRTLTQALEAGGRIVRKGFAGARRVVGKKGPVSLVTETDKASERAILRIIRGRFPRHGIVAEESAARPALEPYRWYIDPLDGTTNFVHGIPLVAVSIGLEHRGRLLMGGVYDPINEEMFLARRGRGAFLNGRRIRVSKTDSLRDGLYVTGFPYDSPQKARDYLPFFGAFLTAGQGVRRLGAAALDLAWVAAGRFEGFWEFKLQPWDVTAGALIVQEAGGRVTDAAGRPYPHYRPVSTLATNGRLHARMVSILKRVDRTLPRERRFLSPVVK